MTLIIGNKIHQVVVQYLASFNKTLTYLNLSRIYLSLYLFIIQTLIIGNEIDNAGVQYIASYINLSHLDLSCIHLDYLFIYLLF